MGRDTGALGWGADHKAEGHGEQPPPTPAQCGVAYLALAEGGAVVDLVAAGALAQGLPAAVDTGLLQGQGQSVPGGRRSNQRGQRREGRGRPHAHTRARHLQGSWSRYRCVRRTKAGDRILHGR